MEAHRTTREHVPNHGPKSSQPLGAPRRPLARWAVIAALAAASLLAPHLAQAFCWWQLVNVVV